MTGPGAVPQNCILMMRRWWVEVYSALTARRFLLIARLARVYDLNGPIV